MNDYVGERLKRVRLAKGLSMRALAQCAHISQSAISEVESGSRSGANLTVETIRRLARALGVSIDVLAGTYDAAPEGVEEHSHV